MWMIGEWKGEAYEKGLHGNGQNTKIGKDSDMNQINKLDL
jgi:hypothetical protein